MTYCPMVPGTEVSRMRSHYPTSTKHFHASVLTLYCVMLRRIRKHFENHAAKSDFLVHCAIGGKYFNIILIVSF